ncbi:MAG: hypothetical protein GXO43_07000 [Crenarchaeota archaeon]|nr:hypothetical protein [Thermoproteota archaeon]
MKWRPATKQEVLELLPDKPLLIRQPKPWKSKNKKYTEYRLYITIPKQYKDKKILVILYD